MSITQLNGFPCNNCTDIDYAKDDPPRPDKASAGSFGGLVAELTGAPVSGVGRVGAACPRLDITL